jgi:DNA adenine methylase
VLYIDSKLRSPFKWVGSKRLAIPKLHEHLPKQFNNYFECFLGGGSLFFSLSHMDKLFYLNDYNAELIKAFEAIQDTPLALMESLSGYVNEEDFYYSIRRLDRDEQFVKMADIDRASRFFYLNKSAFNGVWRVNKSNQHNVSFGYYKKLSYPDLDHIVKCSDALKKATVSSGDFESMKHLIKPGDFVYLDPAYVPVSKTSSFTQYTNSDSGYQFQIRLKAFCDYIHSIGAYFMQSNSVAPFVLETYSEYNISKIEMPRTINCKGSKRGLVGEVLIKNY